MLLLAALGACHDSDGGSAIAPPGTPVTHIVLEVSQHTGSTGTTFLLGANVKPDPVYPLDFEWELGDGSGDSGQSISVQYASAGNYAVRVRAVDPGAGGTVVAEAEDLLTVIDPAQPQGLFGEALPSLPGDIDQNSVVDILDVQRIYQHLGGAVPLSTTLSGPGELFTEFDLADVDQDGDVDDVDAEYLAKAELLGQSPSMAVPSHGMPGRLVTLFSPALLELEKLVTVRFGVSTPIEPPRVIPGQVTVVCPLDVLSPQQFTEESGTAIVEILHDGVVADSIVFQVDDFPPIPPDGIDLILGAIESAASARAQLSSALQALSAEDDLGTIGLEANDVDAAIAALAEADSVFTTLESQTCTLIDTQLTAEQQEFVLRFSVANGLLDLLDELESLQPPQTPAPAGGDVVAALCAVAHANELLETSSTITSYSCTAVAVLVVIIVTTPWFPDDIITVPALLTASAGCAQFLAVQELVALFLSFIPTLGQDLKLRPEGPTDLPPGGTVTVVPELLVSNLASLCNAAADSKSGEALEEWLAEPITEKVLKKAPLGPIFSWLKSISPGLAEQFEEAVEDAVVLAIDQTVGELLGAAFEKVCEALEGLVGSYLPVDPQLISVTSTPTDPALSVTKGPEVITLTCPSGSGLTESTTYAVKGSINLCGDILEGSLSVTCSEFVDVTIAMGDNGSALDDIFQVAVDGNVVLTSSVPVTYTETTISLSVADHLLEMTGLAAPDGIGTYFIAVSGGELVDGPPLSGTDLTAGTTFTWTLKVTGAL